MNDNFLRRAGVHDLSWLAGRSGAAVDFTEAGWAENAVALA
jgi:hypothetical protein